MKILIRETIKKLLPGLYYHFHFSQRLIKRRDSFLYQSGWDKSIKEKKPLDAKGNIIPWTNYAFVAFLDKRIDKNLKIFEFGSGFSTCYFNSRGNEVVSAEHHKDWISIVNGMLPNESKIIQVDGNDSDGYANSIVSCNQKFDFIFVDGLFRNDCVVVSIDYLTESGVLVLDDSERKDYETSFQLMKEKGFKELTFSSFKPGAFTLASTTVFYKSNNCLGI